MKWEDIQIATLQKMFVKDEIIDDGNIDKLYKDDDCKVYIANMPAVANEAISRVSTYCENKYVYNETENQYEKVTHEQITSDTDGSYEIDLPEEACVLIPLYMASQLYKDDDIAQATAYRNEFEVGLADLTNEIENQHEIEDVMGGI